MRGSINAQDLDDAVASLASLGGDLPNRVLADALNHTANQANQALRSEIDDVFDQPTPFTRNAIRILNATPSRLEAALWVKDDKDNNSKGQAPKDWVAPRCSVGPGWTRPRIATCEPSASCPGACSSSRLPAPAWTGTAT
jgi:hypothetical protein